MRITCRDFDYGVRACISAVGQQVTVAINSIKAIVGQEAAADRFVYKGRTYVAEKLRTCWAAGLWNGENNAAIAT